jgi:hypothetical protein
MPVIAGLSKSAVCDPKRTYEYTIKKNWDENLERDLFGICDSETTME